MMRSFAKMYFSLLAVAIIATAATTAAAAGLLANGDAELESRFTPHGTPGADTANGIPDSWHHSGAAGWNPTGDGMVTSGVHSLYMADTNLTDHEEMRSFVENLSSNGGTWGITSGQIPDVGLAGRSIWVSWKWKWNITSAAGDLFSTTVRTSTQPVNPNSLDLQGNNDNGVQIRDNLTLTNGTANSNGFQMSMVVIPLLSTEQTFDVIFRTRDNTSPSSETGQLWVDDVLVSYHVPEPATMGLLGLSGFGLMMISRRRRG